MWLVDERLPHRAVSYLPDGTVHDRDTPFDWFGNHREWGVMAHHQAVLVQVGYVDRLVGELLDRLERHAMLDDVLVVGLIFFRDRLVRGTGWVHRPATEDLLVQDAGPLFSISTGVHPEVLLIDEALAVGNENFRKRSEHRIRQWLGEAGTVFVVSHSFAST